MNCPCFAKRCGASWSGRKPKSPRPALGICDVLTPTPSAYPYGYSIWVGGANGDGALAAVGSGVGCAEVLSGPGGGVGRLVEMSLMVAVMRCSMWGSGGSWTSGGGVLWWWSLMHEASGWLAEFMLGSCASVGLADGGVV